MAARLTIPLSELGSADIAFAGGKGASLGELIRAGMTVPLGFAVTSTAFDAFMTGEHQPIVDQIIRQLSHHQLSIEHAESEIAKLLETVPVPLHVKTVVEQAVLDIAIERFSVRSSATCEDSRKTTWAGQLDTYLNVKPADVVERLRDCWLSMFSKAALAYGMTHGYGTNQFSIAVVIQKMVNSDISGIGFSVHPVTQEPKVMLIEACLGLGEAIVSGRIVPDQYAVDRDNLEILEQHISTQREGLFIQNNHHSLMWQQLNDSGTHQKLSEKQIIEYATLLDRIADHYGHPVDSEWAIENDTLYVLQARPITTLADEYDQPLIQFPDQWQRVTRRPMSLLEVSIFSHWLDSEHARKMGIVENRVLSIQDDAGVAVGFWAAPAIQAAMSHIQDLYQQERHQLIDMLQYGQTLYPDARQKLKEGAGAFENIDAAVDFLINTVQFTTSLPALVLMYYEHQTLDDPEVRNLAETLRADSLYSSIENQIINPIAAQMTSQVGFSDPSAAPWVTTWSELRQESIDCAQLEARLKEVQSGKRFIFQSIDGQDSVQFVAQTGYLLMRLAKQRQIASNVTNLNELVGQTAWPGLYRGRARVILSSDTLGQTIEDGEILISIQSNPTLMPLLRRCGALVTDDGGIACHAAIIARELQIPTVIGTGCATSVIHTGDLIEVDSYKQVVRIIEHGYS